MIRVYIYEMNNDDLTARYDEYLAALPEWRRESCERMRFERGKLEELAAGLLLRHALKEAGIDLAGAHVEKNEHGKPAIVPGTGTTAENGLCAGDGSYAGTTAEDGLCVGVGSYAGTTGEDGQRAEVHFNLSHSDGYVTVAVADCPVGIDIETKTDPELKISARFYAEEEQAAVRGAADPQKEFRRIWTRKEAYVKCTGSGLNVEISEIPALPETSGPYRLITVKEEEAYALSLVAETDENPEILLDTVDAFDI